MPYPKIRLTPNLNWYTQQKTMRPDAEASEILFSNDV